MKIIVLTILFVVEVEVQYIDEQFSLLTTIDQKSTEKYLFTSIEQTKDTFESSTKNIFDTSEMTKFPFTKINQFDLTTLSNEILFERDQWFNVNQTHRQRNSLIFWRKLDDSSTYILRSEGQCLRQMCQIKLKYNGSLAKKNDGCLSFILWTRGQPIGQLWIEEDEEQENFSQKIQLTNTSLRVEHSLKSNIKNLSIDTRILFRNSQEDIITLSNLNIKWKGPCPKYSSIETIFPQSSTEETNFFSTNENIYETSRFLIDDEKNISIETSTIKINQKESFSLFNQNNIGWILSLIVLFCLLIISSSFLYGLWTIQGHYRFTWYIPYDYPIQFISRRSIRSSTRSQNQIQTLQQISSDLLQIDSQQDSFSTNTTRSSISYSYF